VTLKDKLFSDFIVPASFLALNEEWDMKDPKEPDGYKDDVENSIKNMLSLVETAAKICDVNLSQEVSSDSKSAELMFDYIINQKGH
jgi:hypothetical protein